MNWSRTAGPYVLVVPALGIKLNDGVDLIQDSRASA